MARTLPTPSTLSVVLSPADVERYRRDGFLVVEGVRVRSRRARRCEQRAVEIVEAWEPTAERTVFTTDQQERTSNREFLESGASIWCFFEADAFDESGELGQDKTLSINKIGHAMHDLDPVFESFSYTPELADVATDIGMGDPLAIQSMYIFKQPHIGGEVGCHQDATFLYTEPLSVVGFWFAIEDATLENGCLWAQPGGHRGPLRQRFERAGTTNDDGTTVRAARRHAAADTAGQVSCRSRRPAGTLVVLDGLLPHWSDVNRSATSRHAYSLHCIDGTARYPASNWLQRPASMPLRSLAAESPRPDAGAVSRPLRAGAEGAAPRSPRRRAAPGHGRRAGQRVRLHAPADDRCRRAGHVVQPRRQAQRPRPLPGDVRPHDRRDAAPRRHRAGRLRVRRGPRRRRRGLRRGADGAGAVHRGGADARRGDAGDPRRLRPRVGRDAR